MLLCFGKDRKVAALEPGGTFLLFHSAKEGLPTQGSSGVVRESGGL